MEKIGWSLLLIVLALLSVVSIINITGFVVDVSDLQTQEEDDESTITINEGIQVQFPGSGGIATPAPGDGGDVGNGEVLQATAEVHLECVQEMCLVVEGLGDDLCSTDEDCLGNKCGNGMCDEGEDSDSCAIDCPMGAEAIPEGEVEEAEGEVERETRSLSEDEIEGLSEEELEAYLASTYKTCTFDFQKCLRVPKVTGNERDLCENDNMCIEMERLNGHNLVQLSDRGRENLILRLVGRIIGLLS